MSTTLDTKFICGKIERFLPEATHEAVKAELNLKYYRWDVPITYCVKTITLCSGGGNFECHVGIINIQTPLMSN